jgi:hypothetical protein
MKRVFKVFLLFILLGSASTKTFAWGKTGHGLVAEVAFHILDDSTQKIVKQYLGNLSIEDAANWMDMEKSNSYYNYMRSWHYLDIDKGEKYTPTSERNVMTVLHAAIVELRNRKQTDMSKKEIRYRLLLIFHLVGDLHQPLHAGYAIDKGGNTIQVNSPYVSGNLHSVWDTQILEYKSINLDTCLSVYNAMRADEVANFKKINELKWMYESRSYLDKVYSFENNFLDKAYIDNNILVIKKQLVVGGIRLASILDELFNPANNKS